MAGIRALMERLIKHNPVIQLLYRSVGSAALRFAGLFIAQDEKLILFSSYGGRQYSDSPRVLFEAMCHDPRYQGAHFVWAFQDPDAFPMESEKVKIDSVAYFRAALKARVWITNVNIERCLHFKKSGCVYLNTWHGTGPKKGGNAVKGRKDYDFSNVDILCYDGDYQRQVYLDWFGAKEENLFHCGRPRDDELIAYTEDRINAIRGYLGIPSNKKVIIYVPTWRDSDNRSLDYETWEKLLGEDYVLLVRSHHFAKHAMAGSQKAFCIDVSKYPNINDLYAVSDILISDYSSAFFDYALLNRPMICYAYDYEVYSEQVGLFMDLAGEFPGGICRTEAQVLERIQNMDFEAAARQTEAYCRKYIDRPENATGMCLDRLWEKLGGKLG